MRCAATVPAQSVSLRSRTSPTDPRCRREAVNGHRLCRQHQLERWCGKVGCRTLSRRREQTGLWLDHYGIVERILRIPSR